MIFQSIDIQHFLSIEHIHINLQDRGLVMISGENLDNPSLNNNGSGKSAIIEAIVYALYGKTLRGLRGEEVVNRVTQDTMCICLSIIDDDNSIYRIIRQRNPAKYALYRDDVNITPKSELDFDDYIIKLLQSDFAIFTASLLYSADSFKLSTATDSDIKKAFDTILGLDVLAKAGTRTKERLKDLMSTLNTLETQLQKYVDKLNTVTTNIKDLKQSSIQFENNKISKQKSLAFELTESHKTNEKLNSELEVLQTNLKDKTAELDSIYQQSDELDDNLKELANLKHMLASVKQQLAEYISAQEYTSKLLKTKNKQLSDLQDDIDIAELKISKLKTKINSVYNKIGMPCDTCGQPLTQQSLQSVIDNYVNQIAGLQSHQLSINQKLLAVSEEIAELQTELTKLNAETVKLRKNKANFEQTIQNNTLTIQRETLNKQIKQMENQVMTLKTDIKLKQSDITQNQKNLDNLSQQLKDVTESVNPYDATIQKFLAQQQELTEEIQMIESDLSKTKISQQQLNFWDKGFSNQGIKSFVLDDVTPFLNRRLNKYLSRLTAGQIEATFSTQKTLKSGEKREKFSLTINNAGGGNYQSNSSGEKKRIDLAINLALQDLVASRASKQIDIAMFDEIFDSLDENGIDGVISLLQDLAQEKSTIFVITHNEYLKSYFTNGIRVVKQNGLSNLGDSNVD